MLLDLVNKIVIYGQVYWQNKNEGWQNQESEGFYVFIRLFWEFYGQWGVLMCCRSSLSSFFCEGPGFYFGEVRPKAEPNQNKTLAPNKKNLINCWGNTSEHRSSHEIPRKAWWQHKKTNCLILLHLLFILAVDLSICNFIVFFKKFFFSKEI